MFEDINVRAHQFIFSKICFQSCEEALTSVDSIPAMVDFMAS
jgi:hypothetical protein